MGNAGQGSLACGPDSDCAKGTAGVDQGSSGCGCGRLCQCDTCQDSTQEVLLRCRSALPSAPHFDIERSSVALAGLFDSPSMGSNRGRGSRLPPLSHDCGPGLPGDEEAMANARQRRVHVFESGARYEGELIGSTRHGHGVQTWLDGAVYNGQWEDDRAHGAGGFHHSNGDMYNGQWDMGKASGEGEYRHRDGAAYRGQWAKDAKHGQGHERWVGGEVYEGQYLVGLKHGRGKFLWPDGSSFTGEFYGNTIHGRGTYDWADGRSYEGQWHSNSMHGHGSFRWQDGRSYVGGYYENAKHGRGLLVWPDGKRREITFNAGTPQLEKGDGIQGDWSEGSRFLQLQQHLMNQHVQLQQYYQYDQYEPEPQAPKRVASLPARAPDSPPPRGALTPRRKWPTTL